MGNNRTETLRKWLKVVLREDVPKAYCGCNLKAGQNALVWSRRVVVCECCHAERLAMLEGANI